MLKIDENRVLDEIESLLEKREGISSLTGYYYSTMDICNLLYIYKELTGESLYAKMTGNSKFRDYMRKYKGMIDTNAYFYFLNQEDHTNLAKSVLDTFEKNNFMYYGRRDLNRLKEKEFFEIERDFLGTYDDRLLKLFDESVRNGLIDMRGKNKGTATTYMRMTSNRHYVLLPEGYNIEGLVILSHELAHLHSHIVLDTSSKKQLNETMRTYYEAYSHYMEQCLFDYLKKNHVYLSDTAIDENNYYSWMYDFFDELYKCKDFESDERDYDVLSMIGEGYQYSYGMLLGVLLNERYRESPIETKKDIDNYLFNCGLFDKEQELEILGLTKEDLESPKVLSKRLQKHDEFYRKYN